MPRFTDNTERDNKIMQEYKDGYSFAEIGDMNGLCKQRVGTIIRTKMPDYVKKYKTSERHRKLCNKRHAEKQPPKPKLSLYDSFIADKIWQNSGVKF